MKGERVELKSGDEIFLLNPRFLDRTNTPAAFMFVNMRDRLFDNREMHPAPIPTSLSNTNHNHHNLNNNIGSSSSFSSSSSCNDNPNGLASATHIEEHYIIGNQIGSGTSGQVHICIRRKTGERCAVKIIDTKKFALTPGLSIVDLREEAQMLQLLDHVRKSTPVLLKLLISLNEI